MDVDEMRGRIQSPRLWPTFISLLRRQEAFVSNQAVAENNIPTSRVRSLSEQGGGRQGTQPHSVLSRHCLEADGCLWCRCHH
jgi:hypothetical protein